MDEIKVKAPAKINLGLNIVSKRDDGYHNIETIFYPINLYDIISFKKSNEFKFTTNSNELNTSTGNLIVKAKELLEVESKKELRVQIKLEKNIPIGAGLGGGSSDAASTLIALNKIFRLNIEEKKLKFLAFRLGSDVPFFLHAVPSYASSRGEVLEQRNYKINYPILIVNPGIHISTKWAYNNISPKTPVFNLKDLTQEQLDAPSKLKNFLKNDFEELVINNYPSIKEFRDELLSTNPLFTMMSGSGSTFFSFYKEISLVQDVIKKLNKKYFVFLQNSK